MPPPCQNLIRAHPYRVLLITLALALPCSGLAYDGFTVGLLAGPPRDGPYVLNAHAVQPVLITKVDGKVVQISARTDLTASLAFQIPPAVGLAAVTGAVENGVERYLGLGGAVSFPGQPLWSVYLLTGLRAPIARGLHGVVELQLTSNYLITAPHLGLALEYSFGGQ